jgi:hypothetical protein
MKTNFPQTLEAAKEATKAAEKSQWRIGDALLREADDQHNGPRGLNAVAEELSAHDLDYTPSYLRQLRGASEAFPRIRRHDLPWAVHQEAGNPDALDVIVKVAKRDGEKVTKWYVRGALQQLRKEASDLKRAEAQKTQAQARKEEERARAEEDKARADERVAETERERERAKQRKEAARQRKLDAQAKRKAAKSQSKRIETPVPDESEVTPLRAVATVRAHAGAARRLADECKKLLNNNVAELSPAAVAGLTDSAMRAANAWTEVAALARGATANKRGHLSVVNE